MKVIADFKWFVTKYDIAKIIVHPESALRNYKALTERVCRYCNRDSTLTTKKKKPILSLS
ncbi:hypothetical protein [Pedobacter sp. WC2423]|uniref:hypothetical protein n=1 Tax=Pedobacter sp. WC2423 TaxID=3234142 RepID=UPI003466745F